VDSTYAILKSDFIIRSTSPWLTKLGLPDLPPSTGDTMQFERTPRVFLLGFSWTASSLLEEIARKQPGLLPELKVVDFNPQVIERLRTRNIRVAYGDISQRDTLHHAGIEHARIIVCSLPDTLLKGASNRKLLQQLRDLNPDAQIFVHAERIGDIPAFYEAGAAYVTAPRLLEAAALLKAIEAAQQSLLDQMREEQAEALKDRREVIA
jgi:hypothetical protein